MCLCMCIFFMYKLQVFPNSLWLNDNNIMDIFWIKMLTLISIGMGSIDVLCLP